MTARHLSRLGHRPDRYVRSYLSLERDSEARREQAEIAAGLRAQSYRNARALRLGALAFGLVSAAGLAWLVLAPGVAN